MEELDMNQRRVLALRELHDAWERGQREAFDLLRKLNPTMRRGSIAERIHPL